ncbi:hypothetical protein [Pedobacter ureilyticus]|uniref:N-acetyltransferase domain-containing protein n=1 Tax=Pedobacter ureilyticus TaxID=1393051 RepID=A0ABW9J4N8_9SPHI|nr:hypothetical protein [Pedobacter helvus]
MAQIVAVSDKKLLAEFVDFPHELYKNDPYYVPELHIAQRDMLTPGKHPFHDHAKMQLFLAVEGEKIVGRVAAIINGNHNATKGVTEGFFGFFDTVNDKTVSSLLLNAAQNWLKENGQTSIMGPVNFSTNDICGLLIKGFDGPPVAMMPYNAPYYLDLLEDFDFTKKVDLRAYRYTAGNYDDRSVGLIDGLENRLKRSNIIIRKINLKKFKEEAAALKEVYNKAWDKNLGFVPMTDKEFNYTANDLKLVLDTDFCYIAEQEGKIVAFALAIPDINQILIKIKRGRLFPTGLIKLLLGKKKINGIRIMLLGVIDGYRKMGIEACLYGRIIKAFKARNFQYAEASWTLEDNDMVNRPIENIGGKLYREYRILEKKI